MTGDLFSMRIFFFFVNWFGCQNKLYSYPTEKIDVSYVKYPTVPEFSSMA